MKKIKRNVTRFLRKYQMDYLDVDIDLVIDSFLSEMQRGLAGKKSTLDMIPTYIEVGADVPTNKRVIVVDAIAFILPNQKEPDSMLPQFITSIREIEKRTGLDFMHDLDDDTENKLETSTAKMW